MRHGKKASEPSLLGGLTQSAGSKHVTAPRSLVSSTDGHLSTLSSALSSDGDVVKLRKASHRDKENSLPQACLSDPPSPVDPNHKPSYLKLSCAVSGYGKYSRYSTYQDVNRRSPYSSQGSLRSEASSPEPSMPAERRAGQELTGPDHKMGGRHSPWTDQQAGERASNVDTPTGPPVNGHGPKYPTGDVEKDGEYFLQHTQFEEDRIRAQATRAEAHMRSHDLPEEACGRIRSAIGKANLLVTQKFV
ncbi:disks large-associated protein 4, partial [Aplysia californica]|uniref:Disks large-associated protein 4 n=1 Tax=Aplysia californica TaxID=6500 RepID=A0ABM1AE44_APLCA